ncbi:hypothetical protein FRC12_016239 [Ceratobasidium sp. 428]|nr:hypothetical protein FRC12_016239 [Ceratobasidium sp. 428]
MVGASIAPTAPPAQLVSLVDTLLEELDSLVSPTSSLPHDVVRSSAGSITAQLRDHSRQLTTVVRNAKKHSSDIRDSKDQAQLGLQNLLYERRHLEREIEKCRQFNSIYQDVPLQPLEEFMTIAPEEARTEEVLKDEHQLLLRRLNLELSERMRYT